MVHGTSFSKVKFSYERYIGHFTYVRDDRGGDILKGISVN